MPERDQESGNSRTRSAQDQGGSRGEGSTPCEPFIQQVNQRIAATFELNQLQDILARRLEGIMEIRTLRKRIINAELGGVLPPPYASPFYGREWWVVIPLIAVILAADFVLNYKAFTILEGLPEYILYVVTIASVVIIAVLAHHIAYIMKMNHLKSNPVMGTEKMNLTLSIIALVVAILALTGLRSVVLSQQSASAAEGGVTATGALSQGWLFSFALPLLLQCALAVGAYMISYHYIHPTASLERKEKQKIQDYRDIFQNYQSGAWRVMGSLDPENRYPHEECFRGLVRLNKLLLPEELEEKDLTLW